ncbi:hypothetical protein D3C78_1168900 [compost metagenome]
MGHLRTAFELEDLGREMRRRAVAGRGVVVVLGLGLGQRHQFGHGLHRHLGVDHHQRGRIADHAYGLELRDRVVAQLLQRRAHAVRADVAEENGVAVGRGARHMLRRDGAVGAGLVLDDHLLAQQARHLLRHDTRHGVVAAAGRRGNDQGDGLVGEGRMGQRRQKSRAGGDERGRGQQGAASVGMLHFLSPVMNSSGLGISRSMRVLQRTACPPESCVRCAPARPARA